MEKPCSPAEVRERLDRTENGGVKNSIKNCLTVFRLDEILHESIRYNLFTEKIEIVKSLWWRKRSPVLNETDVNYLMLYLEETYGLSVETKISRAISIIADKNKYHPIQEKLKSLVWDGEKRIENALPHFLGVEKNEYTCAAMRLFMLGAIHRAFQPGCKFEMMLCLVGGQGAGKSTFFRFLAIKDEWFTEEITFKADALQTITMKLPSGVKFHNVSTGKTSAAGASVEVSGGTKFYLSAPLTQAEDVSGSWAVTMKGSITKDYSAYKITTGSSTQDLALVFGEGVTDEKYVDFSVEWVKMAKIEIVKKDAGSNAKVAGAVYGIYSDEAGKNLIAKMPATDANGASSITIEKTQNTVYLKEISVPNGYVLDTKAYGINLVIGGTTKKDVTDKEQFADLTVYKEGEVLTGASVTDSGVVFQYTKQRLKGAVYNVYAGADIKAADGRVIFQKGALVKEGLTTGEDGSATLKNLHLGTYVVTETKAPADYVCKRLMQREMKSVC